MMTHWAPAILYLHICAYCPSGAQTLPPLDEVLTRIQANLMEYQATVPSFVAEERVSSKQVAGGAVKRQAVIDSLFTCVRRSQGDRERFVESREVTAADGKPVAPGRKLRGPVVFRGAFVGILRDMFSAGNLKYHNFAITGMESMGAKS